MTDAQHMLSNLLSYLIKKDEAPCSAETHLFQVLYRLMKLAPEYTAKLPEAQEILDDVNDYFETFPEYIPKFYELEIVQVPKQESLGEPFESILHENLWDLYVID